MSSEYTPNFEFLDDEERDLASLDPETTLPESEKQAAIEAFRTAAAEGRKSVTVRLELRDLDALKRLAEREGMPYQTLLGSVIHKYVTGAFVDLNEARKLLPGA